MQIYKMRNGYYSVSSASITMIGLDKQDLLERFINEMNELRIRIGVNPKPITIEDIEEVVYNG